jgi:pyruvyl transferase EpsO
VPICNGALIEKVVGEGGAVLYQGGGNWGDIWGEMQQCRRDLLQEMAGAGVRRVIGMPQSMFYHPDTRQEKMQLDNRAIDQLHKAGMNVTLYWRQANSYEDAQSSITSATNVFTPDAAWAIGPLFPNKAPTVDVIFLLRRDKESKPDYTEIRRELDPLLADSGVTHVVLDWFDTLTIPEFMPRIVEADGHVLAETLTSNANTLLSQGRIIVTNRLHATILATLMGKPVFYADNIYGKIHSTLTASLQHPSCTPDNLRVWEHSTIMEAAQAALEFARRTK